MHAFSPDRRPMTRAAPKAVHRSQATVRPPIGTMRPPVEPAMKPRRPVPKDVLRANGDTPEQPFSGPGKAGVPRFRDRRGALEAIPAGTPDIFQKTAKEFIS
jgi:hypothetical protein